MEMLCWIGCWAQGTYCLCPTPVSPPDLLGRLAASGLVDLAPLAPNAPASVDVDLMTTDLLAGNGITNAIKYAQAGTRPIISLAFVAVAKDAAEQGEGRPKAMRLRFRCSNIAPEGAQARLPRRP